AYGDAQLKLYGEILPGGFLHYGYFDNPDTLPQDISLNDIKRAQRRYAELMVEQIVNRDELVLDIGCGMGGMTKMMLDDGLCPVALSPDKNQIRHIKSQYPDVPTIESKFEMMPVKNRPQKYGTLLTAESLQYLDLDKALPLMDELLLPGGRWIACDYFRLD
ncbi:class I SAM-dependent methyltransferase, partial [Neisseria meningitidis]|uniref:class I SAM-dependent methyltransferase n=1 Tax=Neisseria meningitidis TaxID=487 RepID=UPI0011802308